VYSPTTEIRSVSEILGLNKTRSRAVVISLRLALNHGSIRVKCVSTVEKNAMGDSNSVVADAKKEMDEMLAGVMPSSWEGHGRLQISERDLKPQQRSFAQRLHANLSEKYPDVDSEKLADKAVAKAKENF